MVAVVVVAGNINSAHGWKRHQQQQQQ